MKRLTILFSFVPWMIFYILNRSLIYSLPVCAFITILIIISLEYQRIKQRFILPCSSVIFFTLLGIIAQFKPSILPHHRLLFFLNLTLASILWFSILIKKPFTLQYAKETVAKTYWNGRLFIEINWSLSIIWAISITIILLPQIFVPQLVYANSMFWQFWFGLFCFMAAAYLNYKLPKILIGRNFWNTINKIPPVKSPFLSGGYEPVKDELILTDLSVIGKIPNELSGTYLRNGPNPYYTPYTYTYPIDGDGMIHSITLHHGHAAYKNRFITTQDLTTEIKAGKGLFAGVKLPILPDPKFTQNTKVHKNTSSINVLRLDKERILTLYDASPAYILNNNLDTIGEWKPIKTNKFLINAHYRKDYTTKQTYMFSYNIDNPESELRLYEFDDKYNLKHNIHIPKPRTTIIHDFVITKNYIIFFDTPALFNVLNNTGDEPLFTFDDQLETDIYLIDRATFEIKQINNIDHFFIYHFVNAFEYDTHEFVANASQHALDNCIIIDFVHYEQLEPIYGFNLKSPPLLYRGKICLKSMTYEHSPLSEQVVEFPQYNHIYTGKKYCYVYLLTKDSSLISGFNAILKYNLDTLEQKVISFGADIELDEVCFVAKPEPIAEDDGYLMFFAYNKITGTSDFIIQEANAKNQTLATIKLPVRVPHGLHGSWSEL